MTSVETIDPADSALFDELYGVYARAYDRDFDQPWLAVEKRVNLTDDAYIGKVALAVRDEGVVVAGGTVLLPLQDNVTLAYVEVFTDPSRRREGHGRSALDAVLAAAAERGRTSVLGEASWGVEEAEAPARDFAEAMGFRLDIMDAQRELVLPADLPPLRVADGYTLHSWRGPCPEEWVDEYAVLRQLLIQEAPSGDVGLENEHWDAARVRQDEADLVRSNRHMQCTVARDAAGALVGHTQLAFPGNSDEVYQWDTLVLPAHRGHGLGLSLKIATMHEAADLLAGRRRIHTYNAASNQHMIAVNEAMGFRQVAWVAEYVRAV